MVLLSARLTGVGVSVLNVVRRSEEVECLVTFYECIGEEKIFVICIFICSLQ